MIISKPLKRLLFIQLHFKILFFVCCLLVLSIKSVAQFNLPIKGIVVDSMDFKPMQFVNIQIKNTNTGTVSDSIGNFTIYAKLSDTLMLSYVGYKMVELPLWDWESSIITMSQNAFILKPVIVQDTRLNDPYKNMFDDENTLLEERNKKLPFYYNKVKKDKIKAVRFREEGKRVTIYMDVVVNNTDLKSYLIKKHNLTEDEYYGTLAKFNEKNYKIMYYLTTSELLSLIYRFYDQKYLR